MSMVMPNLVVYSLHIHNYYVLPIVVLSLLSIYLFDIYRMPKNIVKCAIDIVAIFTLKMAIIWSIHSLHQFFIVVLHLFAVGIHFCQLLLVEQLYAYQIVFSQ